jgi:hypothetical protein
MRFGWRSIVSDRGPSVRPPEPESTAVIVAVYCFLVALANETDSEAQRALTTTAAGGPQR